MKQTCPICGREVKPNPRYPRYVCASCFKRTTDSQGRAVEFFQAGTLGLLAARYTDTADEYMSADCLIDGIACEAAEARFGGIVVQAV